MYIRRWSCVHPQERWTGYEYSFLMLATGDPVEMATYITQSALQASKDAHANISLVEPQTQAEDASLVRKHVCAICSKGFKQKGHLEEHLKSKNGCSPDTPYPFACHCGKRYMYAPGLSRHRKTCTTAVAKANAN